MTAVYNSTHQESTYNDSAYCFGYAIGIDERIQPELKLFPNPTTGKLKVDSEFNVQRIAVMSQSGTLIKEYYKGTELDLSNLPKGVYFIKVYTDKDLIMSAVILE